MPIQVTNDMMSTIKVCVLTFFLTNVLLMGSTLCDKHDHKTQPICVAAEQLRKEDTPHDSPLYKHLFDSAIQIHSYPNDGATPVGWGTGWVVQSKSGTTYVWTAAHVVSDHHVSFNQFKGTVKGTTKNLTNGHEISSTSFDLEIIRYSDPYQGEDLCILKMPGSRTMHPLSFLLDLDKYPGLGAKLYLIGATGGSNDGLFVSEGTLGRRGVTMKARGPVPCKPRVFDHTNLSARPGCSGGPVVDADCHVIGMLTRGYGETHSYFIPAHRIKAWAKKVNMSHALDPSLDDPEDDESTPIEESYSSPTKPKESKSNLLQFIKQLLPR